MIALHEEQRYIDELSRKLGFSYCLREHESATSTCHEKASLLGWPVDRVVKALYLHTGDFNDGLVGIITPETGKIDMKDILMKGLGFSLEQAKRFGVNGYTPSGMSKGTCTPFPKESVMSQEISHLIIVRHAPIEHELVDISMGDEFPAPHKVSMHISYNAIRSILEARFPGQVRTYASQGVSGN
jgi:prolyl-tRNA editing enzyme YbaK/EbsC (Cys-tRNA(Pro) deacylase)